MLKTFAVLNFVMPYSDRKHLFVRKLFLIGLVGCIALSSCGGGKDGQAASRPAEQALDYKVLELQPRQGTLYVDYPASIQGQQNIEIRPKVDGYVEKIFVD